MAKQLLGKEVASALSELSSARCKKLKEEGVQPKLVIIRCGENPSDLAYEKGAIKKADAVGVETETILFPENVTKEELIAKIQELNEDSKTHGVLLFRPLPGHLRRWESEICNTLVPAKDVDSMTDLSNVGVYENRTLGFPPCTAEAVMVMLNYYGIELTGKRVTVIGRSLVIGKPVTMMLMAEHATVTVCHTKTRDVPSITREADIIVTSAGALRSLTKEHVRPGQTVIDVSMNWDPDKNEGRGGMSGDAVFGEVSEIVDAITPVPGGVGAVTSSVLIDHVVSAAELCVVKEEIVQIRDSNQFVTIQHP
jgi:methylenetetrahydrofolate dehydrogenase (NADP+)/methenyltetrahydrofolate cyclohydrolase